MQKLDNTPKTFHEFTPKCIILGVQSYSFVNSGPHSNILNHRTTPSGRKVRVREEEEEEEERRRRKIITTIVATTWAQRRAAHALRSVQHK
jgi:hypothetical protein